MAQQMSRMKKTIVIASVAALTIGGAGVAFAYWTAGGTGEGTATTGTSVDFDVTSETAVGDPLIPGFGIQTVDFTVTNPGPGAQTLQSVTVRIADTDGTTWDAVAGCSAADYTATISTPPVYGEIAADGFLEGIATVIMNNTATNQDACKGVTVPLYFEANPVLTP